MGYVLLSPRQSRSPQLNIALCKSLKYPTCTAVVVLVVTVQKKTKLAVTFCPLEPHFLHAAEYGNYVYFFYREIAVEQSSLGKVRQCTSCLGCRTYSTIPASGRKGLRLPLNGCAVVVMGPFYALTVLHIRIQETSEQRLLGMLC